MPDRLYTIPITCCLDGQAHDVTDENVATGHHRGEYQALCGHRVSASPLAAPVGKPCRRCSEASAAAQPITLPARHHVGWLRRILHLGRPEA